MPPAAPTVQSLSDIVSGITAAQAPENAQLDTEISQNDQSGNAQTAGVEQAKTNAFGTIENNANAKGMYFSGFAPNQEATYTGSTYLPTLAKIQSTVAAARNTLLGDKATLASDANSEGLTQQTAEQDQLNSYNNAQETAAATAAAAAEKDQTTLQAAEIKAGSTAPTAAQTAAARDADLSADIGTLFNGFGARPSGYTESTIIPKLTTLYPDLTPAAIKSQVYAYRKSTYGS